ncbi:hypothetical protein RHEC894_PC00474 (plasmid) [Rhizobium sp. CIAT894]|nr:hypothetical protein RHEC894_PC00474 [Rhizobium sp. CIAT894]
MLRITAIALVTFGLYVRKCREQDRQANRTETYGPELGYEQIAKQPILKLSKQRPSSWLQAEGGAKQEPGQGLIRPPGTFTRSRVTPLSDEQAHDPWRDLKST